MTSSYFSLIIWTKHWRLLGGDWSAFSMIESSARKAKWQGWWIASEISDWILVKFTSTIPMG
jgi:hypothetical protein